MIVARTPKSQSTVASLTVVIVLHAALIAGVERDPGKAMDSAFVDAVTTVGLGLNETAGGPSLGGVEQPPTEPAYLPIMRPEPGWAIIRCRVKGRYFSDCRWVSESAPGLGEQALVRIQDDRPSAAARRRKVVEFKVTVLYP